jgi:glycine dehydrogenase
MIPVTWPEFGNIHPYVPTDQVNGYTELDQRFRKLPLLRSLVLLLHHYNPTQGLRENSAGLMVIRKYHEHNGQGHRNVTLIPSSAHGTNPASAVMAGTKVVIVACDEHGNIDIDDLKLKPKNTKIIWRH